MGVGGGEVGGGEVGGEGEGAMIKGKASVGTF